MALRFSKVKYGGLKGRLSDLQVSLKVFVHHMSNEPLSKIGYLLGWMALFISFEWAYSTC